MNEGTESQHEDDRRVLPLHDDNKNSNDEIESNNEIDNNNSSTNTKNQINITQSIQLAEQCSLTNPVISKKRKQASSRDLVNPLKAAKIVKKILTLPSRLQQQALPSQHFYNQLKSPLDQLFGVYRNNNNGIFLRMEDPYYQFRVWTPYPIPHLKPRFDQGNSKINFVMKTFDFSLER